jgi:tripartite-type tricarboxylate transporter receptor subunit TctC
MRKRHALRRLAALGLGIAMCVSAAAQDGRPLTLVVPSASGSAPDIVARLVGDAMRARLGQPVIVENRPGAGGILAAMAVRSARPDGLTLLFTHAAVLTITPLTYRAAVYDPVRDFEPVAAVAETPMMFAAVPGKGPATLADLLAQAKAAPGAVAVGTTSRGTIPHLSAELLAQAGGARLNLVPMSTSPQAVQTLIGGDTVATVDGVAPLLPLVRAGRLRALAVTSARVLPGLEGIPLARDSLPGLVLTGWFMLLAPKGTPAARVQALNAAVDAALKSPELVQRLAQTASHPIGGSADDARRFLARETALWAGAVARAGLERE